MSTRSRHTRSVADGARAALRLTGLACAFAVIRCMDFSGRGCQPGDCPAGHACGRNGDCELEEGSCASDDDCAEGELCVTYPGSGFFGAHDMTACERGPGEVGELCGASLLVPCVPGASCVYHIRVELSPDPVVGDTGNNYWFEPRVAFEYTSSPGDPICVANGSLGIGQFCSERASCAPDLICHEGYTPKQCQPRSELGGPCLGRRDCASGGCVLPELVAPYEFGSNNCALADPACDIRVDPACGYWLSCAECVPDAP